MKSSFRYINIGIIISLIVVFCWQTYWLKGLYDSMKQKSANDIISCIEAADQKELISRMDLISQTTEAKYDVNKTVSVQKSINGLIKNPIKSEKDKIKSNTNITSQTNNDSAELFDQIIKELSSSLHGTIDSICPPNLAVFDSLVRMDIKNKNIKAEFHYTDVLDLKTGNIIMTSRNNSLQYKNSQSFLYVYSPNGNFAYNVYTDPLTKTVLIDMAGILATTFLIIIILSFAFWYLIHTVLRQKTVEEMKTDFTNNMTHELKTPISIAFYASDALLNFGQDYQQEKRAKYLTICNEQLTKLSTLVEQILSLSREHHSSFILKKENILIKDLINNLVEQHKLKSNKNISFSININPDDFIIWADKTHLNNMISNLIDNAIKYSVNSDNKIKIEVYKDKELTFIEVADNGIGIPPEKQKYIFEKFYRVPSGNRHNAKGYGLGLFYVKIMAEKHGGKVSVKSSSNKGSIFTIEIPELK